MLEQSEFSVEEGASTPPPSGNPPPTQHLEVGSLPSAHADKMELLRQNTGRLAQTNKDFEALRHTASTVTPVSPPPRRRWTALAAALTILLTVGIVSQVARMLDTSLSGNSGENDYSAVYNALQEGSKQLVYHSEAVAAGVEETTVTATYSKADYGKTNTQVQEVDEADIVKNDGKNLYILSSYSQAGYNYKKSLSVVRAEDMNLLSQTTDFDSQFVDFSEMYLSGNQLVLVGTDWYNYEDVNEDTASKSPERAATVARIYEIGEDGTLAYQREFKQDGYYSSSRLVGKNLYLISSHSVYLWNRDDLAEESLKEYIPFTSDSTGDWKAVPSSCIQILPSPDNVYTVISAVSLEDESKTETQTLLGKSSDTIYASKESLYVASYQYDFREGGQRDDSTKTHIVKYSLGDGTLSLSAEGEVSGWVNNQFSMDEMSGYLRIVTTTDVASSGDLHTENRLYVLDNALEQVGQTESLAPGEIVQSVRFMGGMAYVVTFRQTDPLFTIDVSDPQNPNVLGQLKIPGFSSYMHPIDENTLIGIGFDADEKTGGTTGLKFSLFDVSDPTNPIEHSKLILSGDCYSDALYNHKAVTYLDEKGILILPIDVYGSVSYAGGELEDSMNGAAIVLEVSPETGFSIKGFMQDPKATTENLNFRKIQRSTYINDKFYSISDQSLLQIDMETLEHLGQLDLYEDHIDSTNSAVMQTEPSFPEE